MAFLYNRDDNYRGNYAPRVAASEAGREAGWSSSNNDNKLKTALVLVDFQEDFVRKDGNLSVPNSEEDVERTVNWVYKNGEQITSIYASLDTHNYYAIFYESWWMYLDDNTHPAPYTRIHVNKAGETVDQNNRRIEPLIDVLESKRYVKFLGDNSQLELMIWPYHCMEGTVGHCMVPSLTEAIIFHSAARNSQVRYITKGTSPYSEHYGIWGAEREYARDPATLINTEMLNILATYDRIYIAGEAKSHCVLKTMQQTVRYFHNQPDVIARLNFLIDCSHSVFSPDIDFEAMAMAEIAKLQAQGLLVITTQDKIA